MCIAAALIGFAGPLVLAQEHFRISLPVS